MSTTLEKITGYDGDGGQCEVHILDGHEVAVTGYVIDPDELIGDVNFDDWLARHDHQAAQASPLAAAWIRLWAAQTARHRAIDPYSEPNTRSGRSDAALHGPGASSEVNPPHSNTNTKRNGG